MDLEPVRVWSGCRLVYTVTYRNSGVLEVEHLVITDTLPAGLLNILGDQPNLSIADCTSDPVRKVCAWTVGGRIKPGASGTLRITAVVD